MALTMVSVLVLLEKTLESVGRSVGRSVGWLIRLPDSVGWIRTYVVSLIYDDDGALKEAAREDVISGARR